jgi:hypothetical protein
MPRATLHKARVVKNAAKSMASKPSMSPELAKLVRDLADVVESLAMIVDEMESRPRK